MRAPRFVILGILAAMGISSCRTSVHTDYYLLGPAPEVVKAESALPLTIAVASVRCPSRYRDQIVYRTSDFEVGFYEFSNWIEPPAEMIQRSLVKALRSSGIFKAVDAAGVIPKPDLSLQCTITTFDQVIDKKSRSAECGLAMEIIASDGGAPLWSYSATKRVAQDGKKIFVAAMSEAAGKVISSAISDMKESDAIRNAAGGRVVE